MSNIAVSLPSDGTTADVADYNTPINTIVTDYNGNIDNSNIATAAAISGTKLANQSVSPTKLTSAADSAFVATTDTQTTTTYTAMGSAGPAVTVTVGGNGLLLVGIESGISNSAGNNSFMGYALSGANTVAAADTKAISHFGTNQDNFGAVFLLKGLAAGSTTVTALYRTTAGTATFSNRNLFAIPL